MSANCDVRGGPHVLIVSEKWCDCNPYVGPTNSAHNLWGSLEMSRLATWETFHFDAYWWHHNTRPDSALIRVCEERKPTVVVVAFLISHDRCIYERFNPLPETLDIIRERLDTPVVGLWFDAARPSIIQFADALSDRVSFHIILDSARGYLEHSRTPERFLPLWTPQDPRIFFDPLVTRDIPCSFVGSVNGYEDRKAGLEALRGAGLPLYRGGGQREEKLGPEDYAQVFMRSQIAVNFSSSYEQRHRQVKGRVFEALLCGAMLLEHDNEETVQYLVPGEDYVPFSDAADLVQKVRYYLQNEAERSAIAACGHRKASRQYTGWTFWRRLLTMVEAYNQHSARVLSAQPGDYVPLFWPDNGVFRSRDLAFQVAKELLEEGDDILARKLLDLYLNSAIDLREALSDIEELFSSLGFEDYANAVRSQILTLS